MMDYDKISQLRIDEWIWVIIIFLSIMNIFGDECEKDFCIYHNTIKKKQAKKIFIFTLFISLLIYLYLEKIRYKNLVSCRLNKQNTIFWEIRCFGGFLVIIATLLFLYCQIVEPDPQNPLIV